MRACLWTVVKLATENARGRRNQTGNSVMAVGENYVPGLGEVGPVSHDHCAEHHVILGEVAAEELGGTDHGDAEDVGDLVAMG